MKYIFLLLSFFLSPLYVLLITLSFQKLLEPKMNKEKNETVLMAIPNNIFQLSLIFASIVFLYTFNVTDLGQSIICFAIATCILIMITSIRCSKVIFLGNNGLFTKNKSYDVNREDISVVVCMDYSLKEDDKGLLTEDGLLQISLINENNELYTNHFIFRENKEVFKYLNHIKSYKSIQYKVKDEIFKDFDDVFTYLINNISNKTLLEKYKDKLITIYENANPNGDFDKLQISINYK